MQALLIAAVLLGAAMPVSAATLNEVSGLVQVRQAGSSTWRPARRGQSVKAGDSLRTGFNAKAVLVSEHGTVFVCAGNAHLAVEEDSAAGVLAYLLFGAVRVDARIAGGKRAAVRTPVAALRARADMASFTAAVGGGGKTVVDVFDGLVGVEDNRGSAALLRPGQRLESDMRGLREPSSSPTPAKARREDFAALMRRELSWDLARDESLERAARETRRAEHELGRLLTDAEGRRVRVEEYVTRPAADSFKLVVLNQRPGRLDAFAWTGVFDAALPADLGPVLSSLGGTLDAAAPWTLTEYQALFTNGPDRLVERADGGHQVDLNNNADPLDDVTSFLSGGETAVAVSLGRPVFVTLFDRSGTYVNGTLKRGWTGADIQAQSEATAASANDPFTGALLPALLPTVVRNTTFPDASAEARRRLESYADGTELRRDDRALEADGRVAERSLFGPADSGAGYQRPLLERGLHQTISATEFSGRTIEIVGSPRIFVLTGQQP